MPRKGGEFERDISKLLSRWWTGDQDTDAIFWRTSQSGGRATNRRKANKKITHAHCGDITALDETGAPLTRLITLELKNGYPRSVIHNLVDQLPTKPPPANTYPHWIEQATAAAQNARTPYWAIIHHRNARDTILTIQAELWDALGCTPKIVDPPILRLTYLDQTATIRELVSMRLSAFLAGIDPSEIRYLYNQRCHASRSNVLTASSTGSL